MATAAKVLGGLRGAVGLGTWVAPHVSIPLFGLTRPDGSGAVVARLFGVRDFVLAASLIIYAAPGDRDVMRAAVVANIVCDSVDVVACLIGYARGEISNKALMLVGGGAAFFAALGAIAYRGLDKQLI